MPDYLVSVTFTFPLEATGKAQAQRRAAKLVEVVQDAQVPKRMVEWWPDEITWEEPEVVEE